MDKIGPMCRSAEDCGLVLQAIAGGDSEDPGSAGKSFYYTPQYARKLSDLKVGFAAVDMEWAEPDARPAFEAAMQVIRGIGRADGGDEAAGLSIRRAGRHGDRARKVRRFSSR